MLSVLGLTAFLATPAQAARGPEVAVIGVHINGLSDEAAQQATDELISSMSGARMLDPISPSGVRSQLSGKESLVVEGVFLAPGRAQLEDGRVLYERADFEGALDVLQSAVRELESGLLGSGESKDLIDALLLLGLANASIGEMDSAQAAFEQLVIMDPDRELDSVNYPPKIIALFSEVRERVLDLPRGSLSVQVRDFEAEVWVDGRLQGSVPTRVSDLLPGRHYVLVHGVDGRREFATVVVAPGQNVRFSADLASRLIAPTGVDTEERARQSELLYRSLGTHVDSSLVLLAGESEANQVGLQLYEPHTGNFSKIATTSADSDPVGALTELTHQLGSYVSDAGTIRANRVSSQVLPLDINANPLLSSVLLDPEPIVVMTRQRTPWYVWAGVSALAAGTAGGAVLLLTRDGPGVDPSGTITVQIP